MSKARLVLTALFVDGQTPARYGVHRSWVYKLKARFETDGEAAFEPRSRRPKSSPTAIGPAAVDLIVELRERLGAAGLDAGPDTIAWHLQQHHDIAVSVATISRYLTRAGLVVPQPKKRPKSSYIRFQADLPNECWQARHRPDRAGHVPGKRCPARHPGFDADRQRHGVHHPPRRRTRRTQRLRA